MKQETNGFAHARITYVPVLSSDAGSSPTKQNQRCPSSSWLYPGESFLLLLPGYSYPLGLIQDQLLEKLILTVLYMDKSSLHAHTYQHTYTCAYTLTYILTYKHEHINTHVHMCIHRYQMHIIHTVIIYRYMLTHEHMQVGSCMKKLYSYTHVQTYT